MKLLSTYPWIWFSIGSKTGFFLFASREEDATGISSGVYKSLGEKNYFETGVGPGIEISDGSSKLVPYAWGYFYFENKPEKRLAQNKVIFQAQYAYAWGTGWGHWTMQSFQWSPWKVVSLGAWYQTGTTAGGMFKVNIPLGKAVFDIGIVGGLKNRVTFVSNFIIQSTKIKKVKNKKAVL